MPDTESYVKEVTFVGEHLEVYARIQNDTKEVLDVYWDRRHTLPVDLDDPDGPEVPHKDGLNPMFVHATDPKAAFEIVKRDYNVTSDDEQWLDNNF